MKFYSTKNKANLVSAREAVVKGIAEDGGLFMPTHIPQLKSDFLTTLPQLSFHEISQIIAKEYFDEDIPTADIADIIQSAFDFPVPLKQISTKIFVLELFHGPTFAFKDFGARFLARLMSYFNSGGNKNLTVIVATSGDTGSAVASGFYKVDGIKVVILYPSGKVSKLQEQQLTTLGDNISTLEIDGTFDDCQALAKQALADKTLTKIKQLTSANSINIGRLIPQSFYYFYAASQLRQQLGKHCNPIISVPSGNLGNLTAGVLAKKMGLNIEKLIAATNSNDSFVKFMKNGKFEPKPSIQTISNAMDVGNPSNIWRLLDLYQNSSANMSEDIFASSFTEQETKMIISKIAKTAYILEPHGAVGYLGLEQYMAANNKGNSYGIVLETAHPAKFIEVVESIIDKKVEIPQAMVEALEKSKLSIPMKNSYSDFRDYLIST